MDLKYNWQAINECSDELNQIYRRIDSIADGVQAVKTTLDSDLLSFAISDLSKIQVQMNQIIENGFSCAQSLSRVAEVYYYASYNVNRNNELLFIGTSSMSVENGKDSLINEEWLQDLVEKSE